MWKCWKQLVNDINWIVLWSVYQRYRVMQQCWNQRAEDRPSFHEIFDVVGTILHPEDRPVHLVPESKDAYAYGVSYEIDQR